MFDPGQSRSLHDLLDAFHPDRYVVPRALALYSAAITLSERDVLERGAQQCNRLGVSYTRLYETVLQSYLFLGFPRMLIAAETLADAFPSVTADRSNDAVGRVDAELWRQRGRELCRRVYDSSYEALRSRVEAMAPEIFLWMELEGYGKVLSRPGLDMVEREIAIVSCLMMEQREAQLYSHLRGALNVGAEPQLLRDVTSDMEPVTAEGAALARRLMKRLGVE